MDRQRLAELGYSGVAFDTETHRFQPGLPAPPLVCGSMASRGEQALYSPGDLRERFLSMLRSPDITVILANAPFDFLVMAWDAYQRGEDLMPEIFAMFQEGRVFDILTAQMLDQIAKGMLGKDENGGDLRDPNTNKVTNRYSLAICERQVLDRVTAKANDKWRTSYALLEQIPMDHWPADAKAYPIDDAVNTRDIALVQSASHENLHDLSFQVFTDWCLTLGAAWGFNCDPERVKSLKSDTEAKRTKDARQFMRPGILRTDGSEDQSVLKLKVAEVYGVTGSCALCHGSKRVPGRSACECGTKIRVKDLNEFVRSTGGWLAFDHDSIRENFQTVDCADCRGVGFVDNPKTDRGCLHCDGTGLDLGSAPVPRSDAGGVSKSRDTLHESGDDLLMAYGDYGEDAKILTTYIPYLERGIADDGSAIPITLAPNILLNTGRVSYSGVIQLLPRKGGVRECFVPRPGYVFCSCDYGGIELVSHAQSCLWLFGHSKLADVLNAGKDAHSVFAAEMVGESYDAFYFALKEQKSERHRSYRQAAKPANFGFPGGMGGAKLVLQQRAQGPSTSGPDGREYKGLRFCLLIGGESVCGREKVMEWGRRDLPGPTCKRCIECAVDLKRFWLKTYPENEVYLNEYIPHVIDTKGYVVQHVSERKRGGVDYCSAANSLFQGLTADGMKLGIQKVSTEQYTVPSSDLYGTRMILLAHDELVVEMPEEQATRAAARLSEVMVSSMREYTPDVRVTAEPVLMRRWYKDAEPTYNDQGVLIPWEP